MSYLTCSFQRNRRFCQCIIAYWARLLLCRDVFVCSLRLSTRRNWDLLQRTDHDGWCLSWQIKLDTWTALVSLLKKFFSSPRTLYLSECWKKCSSDWLACRKTLEPFSFLHLLVVCKLRSHLSLPFIPQKVSTASRLKVISHSFPGSSLSITVSTDVEEVPLAVKHFTKMAKNRAYSSQLTNCFFLRVKDKMLRWIT